jgi:hypothetical protein
MKSLHPNVSPIGGRWAACGEEESIVLATETKHIINPTLLSKTKNPKGLALDLALVLGQSARGFEGGHALCRATIALICILNIYSLSNLSSLKSITKPCHPSICIIEL